MDKQLREDNKLILLFMGFSSELVKVNDTVCYKVKYFNKLFTVGEVSIKNGFDQNNPDEYFLNILCEQVKYNLSWDWLIPVYSKIMTEIPFSDDNDSKETLQTLFENNIYVNRIDLAFKVIVEFLKSLKDVK